MVPTHLVALERENALLKELVSDLRAERDRLLAAVLEREQRQLPAPGWWRRWWR